MKHSCCDNFTAVVIAVVVIDITTFDVRVVVVIDVTVGVSVVTKAEAYQHFFGMDCNKNLF